MGNERSLLGLFEGLSDGVCVSDDTGRLLYMNPAAERLLDISLAQAGDLRLCDLLCGHISNDACSDCAATCALLVDPAAKTTTIEGRLAQLPSFAWREGRIVRNDRSRALRVRCLTAETPWLGRARPAKHLTLIEDVGDRATLDAEREDWRNMIAHDLRNPLSVVYGALLSLQEAPAADAKGELLEAAVRNCRRMTDLLDLYLDVAKLDAGLMPASVEPVDLGEAARAVVEQQAPLARSRGVRLESSVPEGIRAAADPALLARVLQNLVDNALKFTPSGGWVELGAERGPSPMVRLTVTDTGAGIAPQELPLLFDRYHQAAARRAGRSQGTGLGLAFCRQALKAMKGRIAVDSEPGEGSRFTVELPRAG